MRRDSRERREIGGCLRTRPGECQCSDVSGHQRGDHHERAQRQPDQGRRATLGRLARQSLDARTPVREGERGQGGVGHSRPVAGHGPAARGTGPGSRSATASARTATGGTPNSRRTSSSTLTRTRSEAAGTTVTRAARPAGRAARTAATARAWSEPSAAPTSSTVTAPRCSRSAIEGRGVRTIAQQGGRAPVGCTPLGRARGAAGSAPSRALGLDRLVIRSRTGCGPAA